MYVQVFEQENMSDSVRYHDTDTGAHFEFNDLCLRLKKMVLQGENQRLLKQRHHQSIGINPPQEAHQNYIQQPQIIKRQKEFYKQVKKTQKSQEFRSSLRSHLRDLIEQQKSNKLNLNIVESSSYQQQLLQHQTHQNQMNKRGQTLSHIQSENFQQPQFRHSVTDAQQQLQQSAVLQNQVLVKRNTYHDIGNSRMNLIDKMKVSENNKKNNVTNQSLNEQNSQSSLERPRSLHRRNKAHIFQNQNKILIQQVNQTMLTDQDENDFMPYHESYEIPKKINNSDGKIAQYQNNSFQSQSSQKAPTRNSREFASMINQNAKSLITNLSRQLAQIPLKSKEKTIPKINNNNNNIVVTPLQNNIGMINKQTLSQVLQNKLKNNNTNDIYQNSSDKYERNKRKLAKHDSI